MGAGAVSQAARVTRIGIVAALPDEARCLGVARPRSGNRYALNANAVLRVAGMGGTNATCAAQALLLDNVNALASWGFCGALDATLPAGALALPATLVGASGNVVFRTDSDWRARLCDRLTASTRLSVTTGPMLAHDSVLRKPDEKRQLQRTSAAVTVDMESAAIAIIARQAGLPFITVRSVSDTANSRLPSTAMAMLGRDGQLRPLRGCAHWLCHPAQTGAMLHLARSARRARHSLHTTAQRAGPQLFYIAGR